MAAADAKAAGQELIGKVADHFFTDEFQAVIDGFISEHCRTFYGCLDAQVEGEDNKLEYWAVYQEFVKLFEAKLDEFLKAESSSSSEFYSLCKAVSNSGNDWGEDATFINLLVATSDYESFLRLMKEEAQEAQEMEEREALKKAEAAADEAGEGSGAASDSKGDEAEAKARDEYK